jgi:probable HAF family extracellular repeat protein
MMPAQPPAPSFASVAFCLGLLVLLMLIGPPANGGEPAYAIVDLGKYSEVTAINDSGQVVGSMRVGDGNYHAFLYSNGHVHDLGTLGGRRSRAEGISAAGDVVGWSETDGPPKRGRPDGCGFVYTDGKMRAVDLEKRADEISWQTDACDINSSGQIAIELPTLRAAILTSGMIEYVGTFVPKGIGYPTGKKMNPDGSFTEVKTFGEGYTVPHRINDSGEVVGDGVVQNGNEHAFSYFNGKLNDLSMPGWKNSHARDINSRAQIVGFLGLEDGKQRAFLYSDGEIKDLGVPTGYTASTAKGINASGKIVGSAYNVTGGGFLWIGLESRAFLYEDGKWVDLSAKVNLSGTGLTELFDAERINSRGQIVGKAMGPDNYHAYLLTPLHTGSAPVDIK